MAYSPTDWADGVTPVDEAHLDKIEQGIVTADANATAAQAALPAKEDKAAKGAASGYAPLDATTKVPLAYLPPVGADLSFDGDWVAGTYQDGDVVVKDGVSFMCVGGPTAVPPDPTLWGTPAFGWVPLDGATPAATRILANKLLAADAQQAFRCMGDGKLQWGPGGATAPDVNLYRSQADVLKTDDNLFVALNSIVQLGTAGQVAIGFLNQMIGGAPASPGVAFGAAGDAVLYRQAAGTLKTDGQFQVGAAGLKFNDNTVLTTAPAASAPYVLPNRLETTCATITDWNLANFNGWFMGNNVLNAPPQIGAGWTMGMVFSHDGSSGNNWIVQRVWDFTQSRGSNVFERRKTGGTWSAWVYYPYTQESTTGFPSGAVDGMEAILCDNLSAPGYSWRFRYNVNNATGYPWEFVGGSPGFVAVDAAEAMNASGYVNLATLHQFTVPRSGVYQIAYGCNVTVNAGAGNFYTYYAPNIGGAVNDNDAAYFRTDTLNGGAMAAQIHREKMFTIGAGVTIQMQFKQSSPQGWAASGRYLRVTPVRVT